MKNNLKRELAELITGNGSEPMQDILIIYEAEPGIFKFRDKVINETELKELQKGYKKTIRMVRYKNE